MESGEPRRAFERKERRPHPAAPEATERSEGGARSYGLDPRDTPVMFCVRVPASLRHRVKLAAVQGQRPVQELVAEALEAECRQRGV